MAQDWEQKSVQGIADPAARKAAYYRLQRQTAEDGQDYKTLGSINAKLGRKTQKTSWNEPQASAERDFDIASSMTPLGRAGKLAGAALKGIPKAAEAVKGLEGVGSSIASRVEGAMSGAAQKARQFLGEAKPVAKSLESGVKKIGSKAPKALESRSYAIKGGGTTKPSTMPAKALPKSASAREAKDWTGKEIGSGGLKRKPQMAPAKSNVKARMAEAMTRPKGYMTPTQTKAKFNLRGMSDGKSLPHDIEEIPRSGARQKARPPRPSAETHDESAKFNQQAASQGPRARSMRSNASMGKPGSPKKGGYEPKKLKSKAEASAV